LLLIEILKPVWGVKWFEWQVGGWHYFTPY
jgi:hypothetical protein